MKSNTKRSGGKSGAVVALCIVLVVILISHRFQADGLAQLGFAL